MKCISRNTQSINRFETLEKDFRKVHGDRYDYSLVEYDGALKKVKIICTEHGEFEQTANLHLRGHGCMKCYRISRKSNTQDFIEKARLVHGDKYDYSLVMYTKASLKGTFICSLHGEFEQTFNNHLNGQGCQLCDISKKSNTKEWIEKAKAIHGDKYDYSLVEYKTTHKKVKIICKEHGVFEQTASNHLKGCGCPSCAYEHNHYRRSYYKNKRTLLYYLKVETENQTLYKIGITIHNVKERYRKELSNCEITILKEIWYEDGTVAFDKERKIIKENRKYRYKGSKVFDGTGTTEMFNRDIMKIED